MNEYHRDNNISSIKIHQNNKRLNDQSQLSAYTPKKTTKINDISSIIYIGHLPPEFQENELLSFFSQFGDVTNIHLSRSQRTLRSRGYAFIQFSDVDVASIVTQTMNGYLLMGERKLVSHILTNDKVHPNLFRNKKLHFPHIEDIRSKLHLQRKKVMNQVHFSKDPKKMKRIAQRLLRAEKKKRKMLARMEIDYDYPGYFSSSYVANNSKQEYTKKFEPQKTITSLTYLNRNKKKSSHTEKTSVPQNNHTVMNEVKSKNETDVSSEKLTMETMSDLERNSAPISYDESKNVDSSLIETIYTRTDSHKNNIVPEQLNINSGIVKNNFFTVTTSTEEKENGMKVEIFKESDSHLKRKNMKLIQVVDTSVPKKKNTKYTDGLEQYIPKNAEEIKGGIYSLLNNNEKSLEKKVTTILDNISVKMINSKSNHTPAKNRKTNQLESVQREVITKNNIQMNEKTQFPMAQMKVTALASRSPVKLRSSKCDRRTKSASKKKKRKSIAEALLQNAANIDKRSNKDILFTSKQAKSGAEINVKTTDDFKCSPMKLRNSISNQKGNAIEEKRLTEKSTALPQKMAISNNLNNLEDISSSPGIVEKYKKYGMKTSKTSTMVSSSPVKLRNSKLNKITSIAVIKENDKKVRGTQEKIASKSVGNSVEKILTSQDKDDKERKTGMKVSSVISNSPLKLRGSKSSKVTKIVSKKEKSRKNIAQQKRNVMKNNLENTEGSKSSLAKDTKENVEMTMKLRRSKRTRK